MTSRKVKRLISGTITRSYPEQRDFKKLFHDVNRKSPDMIKSAAQSMGRPFKEVSQWGKKAPAPHTQREFLRALNKA